MCVARRMIARVLGVLELEELCDLCVCPQFVKFSRSG